MLNHQVIKRVERALRFSTLEGMAYGAVSGTGEHFTAAYAVALGASNTQLGFLTSLPGLLGAIAQSTSAHLVHLLGGRKRVVLIFAALSGAMWLPILSVGLIFGANAPVWLIAFVGLYTIFSALVVPAWGAIMVEIVPNRVRGRYFGLRSRWSTLANMAAFLVAGGLLFLLRGHGVTGFALVFGLAFGFRMLSVAFLTTLLESKHQATDEERVSLRAFISQLPTSNLGRVFLYLFSVSFVVNLAGPFFVPYMLRQLEMDYLTFTLLEVMSIVASTWAVTHWGIAADRAGNRRMLLLTGVLISLVPLLWLLSKNLVYLGFVQFYSGLAWAGFNLVSTNFVYDATDPRNRTSYLAYYSAGGGLASSLGALTGGVLIGHVPRLSESALLSMFLLSGILRLAMAVVFLPHIREVRRVKSVSPSELFHIMLGGRPIHRPASHGRVHHHLHGHAET
ncbi:MAG: MFS transporter [Chloroflexi bacterium]|nr:MFS transporter [Chloroflexota bacterium]